MHDIMEYTKSENFKEYKPIGPAALWHMDIYVPTYVVRIMYDK